MSVGLAESPLATDPDRRNLAGLDQSVDGSKVDLQILEDLVRCQKGSLDHDVPATTTASRSAVKIPLQLTGAPRGATPDFYS